MTDPITFSHVGISVPELSAATSWYQEVLGFTVLAGPIEVVEDDTPLGLAATAIYGVGFTRFQFTHMSSTDGIGLEIFQFEVPAFERAENNFTFSRGLHHFALTATDVAATAEKISAAGGVHRSAVITLDESQGYQITYCEDPWGTVFELCSHPYVTMWSA